MRTPGDRARRAALADAAAGILPPTGPYFSYLFVPGFGQQTATDASPVNVETAADPGAQEAPSTTAGPDATSGAR
ncbi:hypothetical protein BJP40_26905 [Streptomyces sp. CC53]|uniref:hypothetical protein n=1 Tax=Streptomyces sp. CC53 TaxID=1906740 RepID=UPI0008DC8886|nr:hypothetical protein [Streptomyces sp. CC53]OII62869.1 hypothetical protein BJP40_26905 [Streptomyces sp. CC53]